MGLEGDPLGRKDLGLPISASVAVVVVDVVGTVEVIASIEVSIVVPPIVVIGTASEGPNDTTQFCPFPGGKEVPSRYQGILLAGFPYSLDSSRDICMSGPLSIRCSF